MSPNVMTIVVVRLLENGDSNSCRGSVIENSSCMVINALGCVQTVFSVAHRDNSVGSDKYF